MSALPLDFSWGKRLDDELETWRGTLMEMLSSVLQMEKMMVKCLDSWWDHVKEVCSDSKTLLEKARYYFDLMERR